ncbi:MAG: hypothetical protein WD690_20020 [Vicinamibacterales bacterium]
MEQRPLRLGDIVDDYCPRERRITNHAIVALVEDTIKQTRCTTCDHEHVFKQAREPRRRKKDEPAALYAQVLSGLQKTAAAPAGDDGDEAGVNGNGHHAPASLAPAPPHATEEARDAGGTGETADEADRAATAEPAEAEAAAEGDDSAGAESAEPEPGNEIWPMHRRLIRAQLPRTGNEPPTARPLPDFTIRQPGARGGSRWGRGGQGGGNPNGNHGGRGGQGGGGQRPGRGGRFAPPRPDGPRGGGGRPGGGRGRRSR